MHGRDEGSADVSGLRIVKGFLHQGAQAELLAAIDAREWSAELRRRVQHYGHRYDYKSRRMGAGETATPLPSWSTALIEQVLGTGLVRQTFDQVIVNEYLPGQGIAPHVDCVPCFDAAIASVSLGSACVMTFSRPEAGSAHDVLLEPGDLMIMEGEARYAWRHQIKARKSDVWGGTRFARTRRVSVTLRRVLSQE